jgi:hypothetical protein
MDSFAADSRTVTQARAVGQSGSAGRQAAEGDWSSTHGLRFRRLYTTVLKHTPQMTAVKLPCEGKCRGISQEFRYS